MGGGGGGGVFFSFSFFSLACEKIFIKSHSIESRCALGPENILFSGSCVHFFSPAEILHARTVKGLSEIQEIDILRLLPRQSIIALN